MPWEPLAGAVPLQVRNAACPGHGVCPVTGRKHQRGRGKPAMSRCSAEAYLCLRQGHSSDWQHLGTAGICINTGAAGDDSSVLLALDSCKKSSK